MEVNVQRHALTALSLPINSCKLHRYLHHASPLIKPKRNMKLHCICRICENKGEGNYSFFVAETRRVCIHFLWEQLMDCVLLNFSNFNYVSGNIHIF
jgi:hypothetical protein